MIFRDMPNSEYHQIREGADFAVSSSQLKDALKSPRTFYKKYVARTEEKEQRDAFDTGTAIHTKILEPEKFDADIAVYEGTRAGAKWLAFQEENKHKTIVVKSDMKKVDLALEGYEKSEIAKAIRNAEGVEVELSCFITLHVGLNEIYLQSDEGWFVLGRYGWTPALSIEQDLVSFTAKTRADIINLVNGSIGDVKSTSSDAMDFDEVKRAISSFQYDMSAAYYLDIFNAQAILDWEALTPPEYFEWIFVSTTTPTCGVYRSTPLLLEAGRAKWRRAVLKIADGFRSNWKGMNEEIVTEVPVSKYDEHWLGEWQ